MAPFGAGRHRSGVPGTGRRAGRDGPPASAASSAASIRTVQALAGRLPLPALEAHRSTGPHIRGEFGEAERLRQDLLGARTDPREFPPDVAGRLLAIWNAYVLQTVAEHLLDAVRYRTFGAVRAEVASRILEFFGPADRWLYQARRAGADPSYRLADNVDLPAEPPSWPDVKYRSFPLSAAMAEAAQQIHTTGDTILEGLARSLVPHGDDLLRLQELLDDAAGAVEYAQGPEDALGFPVSPAVHLRHALRALFLFGQAAAMPALLDLQNHLNVVSLVDRVPATIDPWCLTDPHQVTGWRSIPAARAEIERLWAGDTTPMVTLTLQAQVEAAVRSGAVVFATDQSGEPLGSFHRCPWPAIYEARRPVTVGGTRVMPMQQFTLDVRAGAQAARGVIVSVFVPTDTAAELDDDRARRSAPGRR